MTLDTDHKTGAKLQTGNSANLNPINIIFQSGAQSLKQNFSFSLIIYALLIFFYILIQHFSYTFYIVI